MSESVQKPPTKIELFFSNFPIISSDNFNISPGTPCYAKPSVSRTRIGVNISTSFGDLSVGFSGKWGLFGRECLVT